MGPMAGGESEPRKSALDEPAWDALVNESQIDGAATRVDGDHATVSGTVQTEAERRSAIGAVSRTSGAAGVVCDAMRVDPG